MTDEKKEERVGFLERLRWAFFGEKTTEAWKQYEKDVVIQNTEDKLLAAHAKSEALKDEGIRDIISNIKGPGLLSEQEAWQAERKAEIARAEALKIEGIQATLNLALPSTPEGRVQAYETQMLARAEAAEAEAAKKRNNELLKARREETRKVEKAEKAEAAVLITPEQKVSLKDRLIYAFGLSSPRDGIPRLSVGEVAKSYSSFSPLTEGAVDAARGLKRSIRQAFNLVADKLLGPKPGVVLAAEAAPVTLRSADLHQPVKAKVMTFASLIGS